MPMRRMLAEVDSQEFSQWLALDKMDPFLGGWRDDYRAGIQAAAAAQYKHPLEAGHAFVPDYMPEQAPTLTAEQLQAKARAILG